MNKKVMLIQDDLDCREIMRYILEEEGYNVMYPETKQILKVAADYDLIVIDEFSEGRTGIEICKKLKANNLTSNKPIILTSVTNNLKFLAQNCNADSYLVKPFDVNYFAQLIKTVLSRQLCLVL